MAGAAYDYVLVGAGAAGCVLAERLSADPRNRVLLIEAGGGGPRTLVDTPRGYGRLLADPQAAARYEVDLDGRVEWWLRGRLLGGSSSVNGTVWLRGQPADYDDFASGGLTGWGWREMLACFRALEAYEGGENDLHGGGGPVPVRTPPIRNRLARAFISQGEALGLPYRIDANGPEADGVGPIQHNIRAGRRVGAARAFLDPARRRPNLRVLANARVDRVLVADGRACGVVVTRRGVTETYACAGEVILAAGALESPSILQRSGIGDAARLEALGINPVLDSPRIGRGLQEHMILSLQFRARRWRDSENRQFTGPRLAANLARCLLLRSGPLATGAHQIGFSARSEPSEPRPDLRVMFAPFSRTGGSRLFEPQPGVNLTGFVLRPESRGELHISAADPAAPPVIAPNYLATEPDRRRSLAAVRLMRRLADGAAVRDLLAGETADTAWAQSDDEVMTLLRQAGASGFHATSTCAAGGPDQPLDPRLRVRGVSCLRVADLSILPAMISGHTQAAAMAIGWRAAQLILEDQRP